VSRSFEDRHIGPASVDEAAMLKHLGYSDLTTFIKDVVPANILIKGVIEKALDHGKSEVEVIAEHSSEPGTTELLFHRLLSAMF
jgi:glycine dehydrogenase